MHDQVSERTTRTARYGLGSQRELDEYWAFAGDLLIYYFSYYLTHMMMEV